MTAIENFDPGISPSSAGSVTSVSSVTWNSPAPLGREVTVPGFPVAVLPTWLAAFVDALAEAMQTPSDLPGVLVLAALAAAAGGRAVVEVRPGWREPLNLYTAVAMAPGSRKSAVFDRVTRPLTHAEREAIERTKPMIVEAATRRRAADAAADLAANAAGKTDADEREAAIARAVEAAGMAEAVTVPVLPRILADDATPEALATLLVEQAGRVALMSPEGDVFDMMAGRYSKAGPSLGVYLKAHAGDALRVDRRSRMPEYIESPALTIGLAVQPEVLAGLADKPGFRGRGLLARFLFSLPESNVGHRRVGADPVPDEVGTAYDGEIETLVRTLSEWDDPAVLTFTDDANRRILRFEEDLEPRLGGDLGHLADWGSKLAGATARLAGLLHLAANVRTGWGSPVTVDEVEAAVQLARYFTGHAVAVFDLMQADPVIADARVCSRWVVERDVFTRREIHRAFQSRFPKATDIDPVLNLLVDHDWIAVAPTPESNKPGRPSSPTYLVNPKTQ